MWRASPFTAQVALPVLVVQEATPLHLEDGVDAVADRLHLRRWRRDHQVVHVGSYQRAGGSVSKKVWVSHTTDKSQTCHLRREVFVEALRRSPQAVEATLQPPHD
eukprot:7489442-Heterocapsa_arctica.AAC.1